MKKPLLVSSSLLAGLLVCLAATNASAQESTSPPPAASMNAPPPSGGSMGGGTIGVGAVVWLGPTGNNAPVAGGEFVYDMSQFHIEGLFGFGTASLNGASTTNVDVGVAGWYHLARGNMADFSIGGGAGLVYHSAPGAGNSSTGFSLEPGAEARVFLSPNFALSARVGFAIGFGDNNSPTSFGLGGATTGTTGGLGFTYFFR
jgi:hypothetical protein